jgi:flagellar basal-body rod modification protein FlgD
MAAAAAGIFNHQMATAVASMKGQGATTLGSNAAATTSASATDSSSTSNSSSDSSTISANDFLTLLVTEMQNQDPTADTDPNEYINQLVQVNSLEQLININQTLTTDLGGTPTTTTSGNSTPAQTAGTAANSGASPASIASASHTVAHKVSATPAQLGNAAASLNATQGLTQSSRQNSAPGSARHAPGNLGVPAVNQAGQRVGHALDGRSRGPSGGSNGPPGQ